jgi:PhnB protein
MATKPIPDGFHSVTPHLIVHGGDKALDFYRRAFGAKVLTTRRCRLATRS